jgi:hypothetical protein
MPFAFTSGWNPGLSKHMPGALDEGVWVVGEGFAPPGRVMTEHFRQRGKASLALLTLLTAGAVPCLAGPPTIGYRNDTKSPVVVQGIMIVRGTPRRDKVHILQPGEVAYDVVTSPSNRMIIVADAKQPTRTLFQGTILFARTDQFFSIQNDSLPAKKGKAQQPPALTKVKLTPDTAPAAAKDETPHR